VVNGPGEAREADIGIAGGKGRGILFKNGQSLGTFDEKDLLPALLAEVTKITGEEL
jgi:(E)-4-hydroxy-3-methylbut-2-enyl-diphosphate synthase